MVSTPDLTEFNIGELRFLAAASLKEIDELRAKLRQERFDKQCYMTGAKNVHDKLRDQIKELESKLSASQSPYTNSTKINTQLLIHSNAL